MFTPYVGTLQVIRVPLPWLTLLTLLHYVFYTYFGCTQNIDVVKITAFGIHFLVHSLSLHQIWA